MGKDMEKDMVAQLLDMAEIWIYRENIPDKTLKERYRSASSCISEMMREAKHYLMCREEERESLNLKVKHRATQYSSREEGKGSVQKLYGITAKQEAGLYALCDQFNTGQLEGTGIVAAPFWISKQIKELTDQNLALARDAEEVLALMAHIQSGPLDLLLQPRTSIITGNNVPYIPGETGPRIGDEHLDKDHVYPDLTKKPTLR